MAEKLVEYQAYGGALSLWNYRGPEVLLHGPADTGKTRVCLQKCDSLARLFPGAHGLFVRRHRSDMKDTVVQSYVENVLHGEPEEFGVRKVGGTNPVEFHYNNGSIIRLRGMDDGSKSLGGEYDFVFVSQAEELSESNWNVISTRVTGRSGHTPYPQLLADANPGPPNHFLGPLSTRISLHRIPSLHKDNPGIYDQETGEITSGGKLRMANLFALSGVERERLLYGIWAAAEGIIYSDFKPDEHIVEDYPIGGSRIIIVDFGFGHPLCCQWWYHDPNGRLIMTREIYETGIIVEDLAKMIVEITDEAGEWIEDVICDHDAEDAATLERHMGRHTTKALKGPNSVRDGISKVKARLRPGHDGRPMMLFANDALYRVDPVMRERKKPVSTEQEFASYVWKKNATGEILDEPVKKDDHGMDATRYLVAYVDGLDDWHFIE